MGDHKFTNKHMETLIGLVRENPGIYTQSLPNYKDQKWTNNCWTEIARKLNVEHLTGEMLRKKWKNKRDAYKKNKRCLEMKQSELCTSKVTKINFFDQLGFLDPHMSDCYNCSSSPKRRKTTSSIASTASLSPSASSDSSTTRTNTNENESDTKLDVILMEMSKQMHCTEAEIQKVQADIETRQHEDDFFTMISRRVRMMSQDTQLWIEDQVWELYMHAKRREQAGLPVIMAWEPDDSL